MQAAGIGGGCRHAHLVAFGDHHFGAALGEVIGGRQADRAATDHQDIGLARLGDRGRHRGQALVRKRAFEQRRVELALLEHQGRSRNRTDR